MTTHTRAYQIHWFVFVKVPTPAHDFALARGSTNGAARACGKHTVGPTDDKSRGVRTSGKIDRAVFP
jgi:hypothetical protein